MSEPSNTALAVKRDIDALWDPKWNSTPVGIEFETQTDNEGKITLVDPGQERIAALAKGLKAGNVVVGWYVGDTACLIKDLYGDEKVDKFFEAIGYSDDQKSYGKKLMSTARAYGFPDKIIEQRVEGLTHAHHQVVQGLKEPQRNKELNRALQLGLSKSELYERYKELGGKTLKDKPEYPVWHLAFPAFNKEKDNPEQYVANCQAMIPKEFPYYFDPALASEREIEDAKNKAVDGLPDDLKASTLEAGKMLDGTKFKEMAGKVKAGHKTFLAVEKFFTKNVKNEEARAKMIEGARIGGMSKEAAKEALKAYNATLTDAQKAEKSIEQLVAKIKDPEVRKSLLERAAAENLTKVQFEPIIQNAIAAEMLTEERARLDDPAYQQKLQEKAAAKLAPPKPRKAQTKKAASTEGLPLGKTTSKAKGKKKA